MCNFVYWIFLGLCVPTGSQTSGWLNSLVNYIKKDNNEYQVLLLFDGLMGTSESLKVEDIVQGISRKVPALKISFQEATIEKAHELSQLASFFNPRTTMIVSIHSSIVSGSMAQLNQTLDFVSQVSQARRRPRCLIILPEEEEEFSYQGFLKRMWSRQFLDVTILELEKGLKETKRKEYFPNRASDIATLHQFNPFTNRYDKFKYSKLTNWFPEKTHNLGGLTMKVAVRHFPPSAYVEHTSMGHAVKIYGSDISQTKALSKRLNFKVNWVVSKENFSSIRNCQEKKKSSIRHSLMTNEIQFIGLKLSRFSPCKDRLKSLDEWSGYMKIPHMIVVPVFAKKSVAVFNMCKVANFFILVGVFLSTWLITRILPFEGRNWKLLQIIRIVLGTATPQEPRRTAERILFGAMLFTCLFHSSVIFTSLTDMSLRTETEPELKTAEDVIHSTLKPVVSVSHFFSLINETKGNERLLLEKAAKVDTLSHTCMSQLLNMKNIVCISRGDVADWTIQNNKDSCGRRRMRTLEAPLQIAGGGIVMEARSPYVASFNTVFLRLFQSGISKKWQQDRFNQSSLLVIKDHDCPEREAGSSQLEKQVVYLLLLGYASAMVSFVCEVIFDYIMKKGN